MADSNNCQRGQLSDRITRRRALAGLGAAGVSGLAGCSGGGGSGGGNDSQQTGDTANSGTITLDYWTLFSGGDGKAMKSMVEDFNKQHDKVKINRKRLPWDTFYNKLYTALSGGTAPDLSICHASRLAKYGQYFVDQASSLPSDVSSQYVDAMWKKTKINDRRVALPLDAHPEGLWYNKNIFEQAGLDPEKPPTSYEELRSKGQTILDKTGKRPFSPFPYMGVAMQRGFLMFLNQAGGRLMTKEKTKATFDKQAGYRTGRFFSDISGPWNWMPANATADQGVKAYRAGNLAMLRNGTWFYGVNQAQKFDYGFAKPFVGPDFKEGATRANSHTIAIPMDQNRSKKETQAAIDAAAWLTQNSMEWGLTAGHVPASKRVIQSDKLRKSHVWKKSLSTYYEMAQNGAYVYPPRTKNIMEYTRAIQKQLGLIWSQKKKPKPAINEAAQRVNKIISQ